jgi:hypothetical protein
VISLGARFADYGLTGGLFLVAGTALLAWFFPGDLYPLLSMFQFSLDSNVPPFIESSMISISIASMIVVIFFIGLMLDLLGSVFILHEAAIFREELGLGERWVRSMLNPYDQFISDDLDYLFVEFAGPGELKVARRRLRVFWKPKNWLAYLAVFKRGTLRPRVMKAFSRLESVMLSHLVLNAEPTKLTMLFDQHRLCRVARAIAGGLVMLIVIILFTYLLSTLALFNIMDFGNSPLTSRTRALQAILLVGPLMLLSIFVTKRSYLRYCRSLFALVFVLSKTTAAVRGSKLPMHSRSGRKGVRRAKRAPASPPADAALI